jgi:hypothetical protein
MIGKTLASLVPCNVVANICQVMHLESNAIITRTNVLDHVILDAERFVHVRSFSPSDSLKDIRHAASALICPGPGGKANLPIRRLKLISHDPISWSAISVRKHYSKMLGLETGDSSLRPFGIIYLAGIGLEYIP